jgi:hypothetical protein
VVLLVDSLSVLEPGGYLRRNKEMATRQGAARTVDDRRETVSLIGSDKVEGTAVYGADDNKIGTVQRVMIDKVSGQIAYAVVSFGGFLGMGEEYYPMPWSKLDYDTDLGGYRVDVTEDQLRRVYKYYNEPLWY